MELKLHQGKRIPNARLRFDNQQNCSVQGAQLLQLAYSLSFPTGMSHPRKCAPSLHNNPLASPLPFQGFNNRSERKSQSLVTNAQCTKEQFLANFSPGENAHGPDNSPLQQKISHLDRMLMGLTIFLFDKNSLTRRECAWA
jgi:hypothetical protein